MSLAALPFQCGFGIGAFKPMSEFEMDPHFLSHMGGAFGINKVPCLLLSPNAWMYMRIEPKSLR